MDLIFDKVSFLPGEEITGVTPGAGTLTVSRLGVPLLQIECSEKFNLGKFSEGSYSISWKALARTEVTSAFEVLSDPWARLRYGFVAEFSDDVVTEEYIKWAKRLHLTAIQFYDWAWKHEFLTTEDSHYGDPLGQQISTAKVKELIAEYEKVGATASGYAAIYAVDAEGWERWKKAGLFDTQGKPYLLGENFLWILDPANSEWLAHMISQLKKAEEFGFKAFHLDQYGWPKVALKSDGTAVDLAQRFPEMLSQIVKSLPQSKHIFNNVNDFPTWSTSQVDQHATYIEVWDPHATYGHLAELVFKAREYDRAKPIILSAYLHPFGDLSTEEDISKANASFELAFASITSGGAAHLITGGNGRVLHHAYYVTNYLATELTLQVLQKSFDFVVAAGDLLFDPTRVEITNTHAFGVNEEVKFQSDAPINPEAEAGHLWIRVFSGATGLTIHIINLLDQVDTIWDTPKVKISEDIKLMVSVGAAGLSQMGAIGYSAKGAIFEPIRLEVSENRLDVSINVIGAWTVVNIPFATSL